MDLILIETNSNTRRTLLQQVSLLVNKFGSPLELQWAIDKLANQDTGLLGRPQMSEDSIRIAFWIAKALILRLHETNSVLARFLSLISDPDFGHSIARGFALIFAPDEMLSLANGAVIRLLAKQKVFSICVPNISQAFRHADPVVRPHYLVALSGILKYISTDVLLLEIGTILPLLLQSLDVAQDDVKAATIETLAVVSQESPPVLEGHASTLIGKLLKTAADSRGSSQVRLALCHPFSPLSDLA